MCLPPNTIMWLLTNLTYTDNPLTCGCDIAWLITNEVYMKLLSGDESCHSGELLTDLDPAMYLQLCS